MSSRGTVRIKRLVFRLIGLSIFVSGLFLSAGAPAVTPDEFIDRVRTKFQRTRTIYLEATSVRVDAAGTPSDTTQITLAYRYPKRFLQWVEGARNRQRIAIVHEKTVVVSYPHLEITRKKDLTADQIRRVLSEQLPMVGVVAGFQGGAPEEMIRTRTRGDRLEVVLKKERLPSPFRAATLTFARKNLSPRSVVLETEGRFRITITRYEEEKSFPRHIQRALMDLDPGALEGYHP